MILPEIWIILFSLFLLRKSSLPGQEIETENRQNESPVKQDYGTLVYLQLSEAPEEV